MTAPFAHFHDDDDHPRLGEGALSEVQPIPASDAAHKTAGPQLFVVPDLTGFRELRVWAESYEDTQRARIACENRMLRGGVSPSHFVGQIEALKSSEHMMALAMRRTYRRIAPPGVIAWQKSTFGIGEHLLARLLGALGHPRIATPYHWEGEGDKRALVADPPFERTVRQLWSYCGHGDASRKRRKGMTAEEAFTLGSPRCKMLAHLLAEASIKCRVEPTKSATARASSADPTSSPEQPKLRAEAIRESAVQDSSAETPNTRATANAGSASRRYRTTYDQARERYTERADWTLGHQHNAALRLVAKHLLADLWEASA